MEYVLRSLPVPHPRELVEYQMTNGPTSIGLSGPLYRSLRERQKSCTDVLGWTTDRNVVIRHGAATSLQTVQALTDNTFSVLQLRPTIGRGFEENDESEAIPVVLSFKFWRSEFGGSEGAIGKSLIVAGHPTVVVGVMPKAFEGLTSNIPPAVYVPFSFTDVLREKEFCNFAWKSSNLGVGRLRTWNLRSRRRERKTNVFPSFATVRPSGIYLGQFFKNFHLTVQPGAGGDSWMRTTYEKPLLALELLATFLLLLCMGSTAVVMLARVTGRQQEYAVNIALGASRGQIVRQVLIEILLLTVCSMIFGAFLGSIGSHELLAMLGTDGAQAGDRKSGKHISKRNYSLFSICFSRYLLLWERACCRPLRHPVFLHPSH